MTNDEMKYVYVKDKGYIQVFFDTNGQPCDTVILDSHLAKQFSGYALIKKDIDLVTEALNKLKAGVEDTLIKQSLSFFSIINYAKCFAQTKGRRTRLVFNEVFPNATNEIKENHERIMDQRHDYIAHAGLKYEHSPVTAILHVNNPNPYIIGVRYEIKPNIVFLNDIDSQIDGFLTLCQLLDDHVREKLKKVFKYLNDETKKEGLIELRKRSFKPNKNEIVSFEKRK